MKYVAMFFLLCFALFGTSAGFAQETPSDDLYQASVASDGVLKVAL